MPSITVENYVKQLYLQQQRNRDLPVATGRMATAMGVSPGTATSMMKSLATSGLVEYEPRGGSRLTGDGQELALRVLRRHRLVELFLVQVLGLDWSEVHVEAERLEHSISDKVLQKLDEFLNFPTVDPHGDPIPSDQGHIQHQRLASLAACEAGQVIRIARVMDQAPDFLQFLDRNGLRLGTAVTVVARDPVADAIALEPADAAPLTLGSAAAAKLLVQNLADVADN